MRKFLILAMLCPFLSMCQPLSLKGKVINEDREPVANATVSNKRTGASVMADGRGEFTLEHLRPGDTLLISAVGYAPETEVYELYLENREIVIVLRRSVSMLDEAVVIAYGSTTRRLNLSSVTEVSSREIANQPVSNPLSALQGRVPGLIVNQSNGVPGSAFTVQLRGRTSLDLSLSRNDPLIVIDGVPFEAGNQTSNLINSAATNPVATSTTLSGGLSPLNSINPSDIETITVLKDAGATAIYGSRGANGVILITTRKAKAGRTKASVDVYSGFGKAIFQTAFLNTRQYLAMRREAFANDGLQPGTASAPDLLVWDTSRYTSFQHLLAGNTAHILNANASLSGGSATTRFTLGTGYRRETTVFSNSLADARQSVRLNLFHAPEDAKWNVNLSALWSADNNQLIRSDVTRYLALPPNLKLYNDDGSLAWSDGGVTYAALGLVNPLAELQQPYSSLTHNLSSGLVISYKVLPLFSVKLNAGYNAFSTHESSRTPRAAIDPANGTMGFSLFANSGRRSWIAEPQALFNTRPGKGKLQVLIGSSFQHTDYENTAISATGYTNDLLLNSMAAAGAVSATNYEAGYRYAALFGRIQYDWLQKYLWSVSARRDGSSRFGTERRFSNFGSIAGGWVFSSEPFVQRVLPFLSFGKLRGSYGLTGNDQIGDYKYLDLWTVTTNPYQGVAGLRPLALFNPNFEWEKNRKLEAAADVGFWKDRLLLSVAWYRNRSSNQLVSYQLPNQTGFASVVKNLPAVVENAGWEVTADLNLGNAETIQWTASFNLTLPSNKLVSFPSLGSSSYYATYVVGQSLTVQKKLKFLGVDPATGVYSYEDFDKDGMISTPGDLQVTGDLDPDFYGGFSNRLAWKNFSLDFLFQFTRQEGTNYLAFESTTPAGFLYNQPTLVLNRWQKAGDVTDVQRFGATASSPVFTAAYRLSASDGLYSDASFVRLKNVVLAWMLPAELLRKIKLDGARIYAEAQNLFTITGYKGTDPETQNFYRLPPLQTVAFGIQLNF
jgi:TonB-linked SusC/RagA family outer membrane protein